METITKINVAFMLFIFAVLLLLAEYELLEKTGKFLFPILLGVFYLGQYSAKYAKTKK